MFRRFVIAGATSALAIATLFSGLVASPAGATTPSSPYWKGWDIVRGVALRHTGPGGYVLDAWGGLHPFGGAPGLTPGRYSLGKPYAQGITLQGDDRGGVVVDDHAAVVTFGTVPTPVTTCDQTFKVGTPTRGISLDPVLNAGSYDKHGATVDARGGFHPLCGSAAITTTGAAYWPYHIVRGVAITEGGTGGFTVDGKGGVHSFGKANLATKPGAYWHSWDIARGIAVDGHGNGVVVDGFGGLHPFTYTVS